MSLEPNANPRTPNQLIREKSPYLLQHAYNPVAWMAWNDESLSKARQEQKPVFLSIGYSTCHWCHVMEEESFESEAIAAILNTSFIPIKVDREERPDLDQVYMETVMALTGSGGWPLNVFLTPELEPFYGGTYFPPADRHGTPGFATVLLSIEAQWKKDRDKIIQSGKNITEAIRKHLNERAESRAELEPGVLSSAADIFKRRYDPVNGGFGGAPKFPSSHNLSYLLTYARRSGDQEILDMTAYTLQAMARGGIWDHLGGGFHRYSTDARWHIPHFEKMLYDQALLARTYTEAFQVFGEPGYREIALATLDYVARDLTGDHGAFLSAEDADSLMTDSEGNAHKREGAFYVWSYKELEELLTPAELKAAVTYFGCRPDGNAKEDPFGEFNGMNILYQASASIEETAQATGQEAAVTKELLQSSKIKMFEARSRRPRPSLDDKVLTDWNGLMIGAFAYSARTFSDAGLLKAAENAAEFILKSMLKPDGRILHRWRDGEGAIEGFLDDYIFLAYGLLELYQAGFQQKYLSQGKELLETMLRLFWDEAGKGFYFASAENRDLVLRNKPCYDSAIPSGNSMAVITLARYGSLLGDPKLTDYAEKTLESLSGQIRQNPSGYPVALAGYDFMRHSQREVVFWGQGTESEFLKMQRVAGGGFFPEQVLLFESSQPESPNRISLLQPVYGGLFQGRCTPAVFVCEGRACKEPAMQADALRKLLLDQ